MKIKLVVLLAIFLAMGGSLFAQQPNTTINGSGPPGGQVSYIVGTQYIDQSQNPAIVYVCTSVSVAAGPNPPAGTQLCNWTQSGGGLTQVASLPVTCTPGVTQPVNLTATYNSGIKYCLATNLWSSSPDSSVVYAIDYGAIPDARFNGDATTSNGSNLLNAPTLNCTAADVGKLAIVVKPSAPGVYPFGTGLVTVLSCNSATQAVLSTTANANAGAAQNWAIGTDNGAFLNAAATAAWNSSKAVEAPCGAMIVASPPFATTASSSWAQTFNLTGCIGTVGSLFILHPNVTVGVASGGSFFYVNGTLTGYVPVGGSDYDVTNIRLTSLGGSIPMAAGQMFAFKGTNSSLRLHGVQIHELWTANTANCVLINNSGGEAYYDLLNIQHSNCYYIQFAGQGANTVSNSIFAFHAGGGNQMILCGSATCNLNSDYAVTNGPITPSGSNSVINVNGGYYQGTQFNASGSGHRLNLTGVVDTVAAGGTVNNIVTTNMSVYVANSVFTNASNATPNIFSGTGPVFDLGGNTATNTNGPIMNAATPLFGSASITGTLLATGNLALSANWGTSAATSAWTGATAPVTFTITNGTAAVGASPTITYTFPTPYWVAPLWCNVTQVGGTNASLAPYVVSSLTNTGFVATATGTPTVNLTEFMQVECKTQ